MDESQPFCQAPSWHKASSSSQAGAELQSRAGSWSAPSRGEEDRQRALEPPAEEHLPEKVADLR